MNRYKPGITYPPSFNRLYDYITNENGRLGFFKYRSVYDGYQKQKNSTFDANKYTHICNDFLDDANSVLDYCQWCLDQLPQEEDGRNAQPMEHQSRTSTISFIRNECWKVPFRSRVMPTEFSSKARGRQSNLSGYIDAQYSLRYGSRY
ncbi:hypothetical protein MBANPS3_001425 [Mucor bainieri]